MSQENQVSYNKDFHGNVSHILNKATSIAM